MSSAGSLLLAVDLLYESVVMEPERWDEAAFADWVTSIGETVGPEDREALLPIRRAVRAALKLADFWAGDAAERYRNESSWRARVDIALGPRAWRPTLELARLSLAEDGSRESFALVRERFRLVHNQPWLDGIDYEDWVRDHAG